jgi:hypothetical protein
MYGATNVNNYGQAWGFYNVNPKGFILLQSDYPLAIGAPYVKRFFALDAD